MRKSAVRQLILLTFCYGFFEHFGAQKLYLQEDVKQDIFRQCKICAENFPDYYYPAFLMPRYSLSQQDFHNCHIAYMSGNIERAHHLAQKIISTATDATSNPFPIYANYLDARILSSRNFPDAAIKKYQELLNSKNTPPVVTRDIFVDLADIYMNRKECALAISHYRMREKINDSLHDPYYAIVIFISHYQKTFARHLYRGALNRFEKKIGTTTSGEFLTKKITPVKVLIVEDQDNEAAYLKDTLLHFGYQTPAIASSLPEAVACYAAYQPDISIIDVYLNGKPDGIVFAEEINKYGYAKKPFLFLTSAGDSTTFKLATLTAPYGYFLKPFNELELQYAIELTQAKFTRELSQLNVVEDGSLKNNSFFVKRGNALLKILLDDIKYIEVEGKYSKIVCSHEKYLIQLPLKELCDQLPTSQFSRIHRNYIVNIREVAKIDTYNNEIFLKEGISLTFSRRYIDDFRQYFRVLK